MKKIFLVLSLLGIAGFCSAQSRSLDEAIREGITYFAGRIPRLARVAALPITTGKPGLSDYATERVSYALVNNGSFIVVERNQQSLNDLSREMIYQLSGDVNDNTSLSLGKQLGSQYVINGTFTRVGAGYALSLKALDVEKAQVVGQWSTQNIVRDERIASLDSTNVQARVEFVGVQLNGAERDLFMQELRRALQDSIPNLELVGQGERSPYHFVITVNSRQRPVPQSPNMTLITGDLSIAFFRDGRSVRQSVRKDISEVDYEWFIRRAVTNIGEDKSFFQAVGNIVATSN